MNATIAPRLAEIVGAENVTDDPNQLALFSADFSEQPVIPAGLVVTPKRTKQIPTLMRVCNELAVPVTVRGGGMSYTQAHVPKVKGTVILDMSGLNRVVDLNITDMHLTVETGITWMEIERALEGSGLHLPFGGTFSGERATVGGGLGNNCSGHKSGQAVDYLIGLEVVLADGRTIQTGGRATGRPVQTIREYGPDLTGLFIHDAGTFGIKTLATFKLERRPGGSEFACFGFNDTDQMIEALVQLCRQGIATENAAFSEYHNKLLASQPKPTQDEMTAMTRAVRHMAPTRWHGWRYLMSMARPGGLRFLANWKHSLSIAVDGATPGIARKQIRAVKALMRSLGGTALPPTLPIVYRADPFQPVERLIVGGDERNCAFPTNRLTTLGNAHELYRVADSFFAENRVFMEAHGLAHTIILSVFTMTRLASNRSFTGATP